jgi:LPS sulfotransferase NodH
VAELRRIARQDRRKERRHDRQIFPQPRFVYLWRENVVAQAVSWSRAAQTGYYHHWDTAHGEATFDPEQIDALVREALENRAAWRRWFEAYGIEPLPVRFEDLVREKEATALHVPRSSG